VNEWAGVDQLECHRLAHENQRPPTGRRCQAVEVAQPIASTARHSASGMTTARLESLPRHGSGCRHTPMRRTRLRRQSPARVAHPGGRRATPARLASPACAGPSHVDRLVTSRCLAMACGAGEDRVGSSGWRWVANPADPDGRDRDQRQPQDGQRPSMRDVPRCSKVVSHGSCGPSSVTWITDSNTPAPCSTSRYMARQHDQYVATVPMRMADHNGSRRKVPAAIRNRKGTAGTTYRTPLLN